MQFHDSVLTRFTISLNSINIKVVFSNADDIDEWPHVYLGMKTYTYFDKISYPKELHKNLLCLTVESRTLVLKRKIHP